MNKEELIEKCMLTRDEINDLPISMFHVVKSQLLKAIPIIAREIRQDYHSWLSSLGYKIDESETNEYWKRWER